MSISVEFKKFTKTYNTVLDAIIEICRKIKDDNSEKPIIHMVTTGIFTDPYEKEMNTWIMNFIDTENQYKLINHLELICGFQPNEGFTIKEFLTKYGTTHFASNLTDASTIEEIIELYDFITL